MKPKHQRLIFIIVGILCVSLSLSLVLTAMDDNIIFFYSPSEIAKAKQGEYVRVGGLVEENSIKKLPENKTKFTITDYKDSIVIEYQGILPNLFREGQGIIASGIKQDGDIFYAKELLAKHDENYMPPEVAKTLEKNKK